MMDKTIATMKKVGEGLQGVALFLVVAGSVLMWIGCKDNFPELKTLAASIAGAGLQAITSQIRNTLSNKDGGTINVGSPAAEV